MTAVSSAATSMTSPGFSPPSVPTAPLRRRSQPPPAPRWPDEGNQRVPVAQDADRILKEPILIAAQHAERVPQRRGPGQQNEELQPVVWEDPHQLTAAGQASLDRPFGYGALHRSSSNLVGGRRCTRSTTSEPRKQPFRGSAKACIGCPPGAGASPQERLPSTRGSTAEAPPDRHPAAARRGPALGPWRCQRRSHAERAQLPAHPRWPDD